MLSWINRGFPVFLHRPYMRSSTLAIFIFGILLSAFGQSTAKKPIPPNVEIFKVKTLSPQNREVPFYLRRPRNFEQSPEKKPYRLLFICPVLNGEGIKVISGDDPLLQLADEKDWFVLSVTFKQEHKDVRDRKKSYYYPDGFSGKAILEALEQIARKYPVDTNHLLLQGLSGGAQVVHRFAIWAPERVVAVAVNSCSWFDEPNQKSKAVAWLVTIGDSDPSYDSSLQFVDQLRMAGAAPLFRSYIAMVHEGDPRVTTLDKAFLTFYDELTRKDLGKSLDFPERKDPPPSLSGDKMPFVGDSQDWRYFPNTEDNCDYIPEDSRIYLPSEAIAELWGKSE